MNSGHPLEWFVEPIDDYLKCGICGKVLHDPRATLCGHVFCLECIKPWIERFGICPDRCGEVEEDQLRKAVHIEKRISGLLVRCKNYSAGCPVQILLPDKRRHEKICRYHYHKSQSFDEVDHRRIYKRLRTSSVPTCTFPSAPVISTSARTSMQSQHTYRLKRTRPKEPLGLTLSSGDKFSDGRYRNFFVKKVNRDTLAWKAGIQPGDKIVQVDLYDLCKINPKEAVARIKDKTVVTLTVLRGDEYQQQNTSQKEEHIYDEILYADLCPALSQLDENYPPALAMASPGFSKDSLQKRRAPMLEDLQNKRPASPLANHIDRATSSAQTGEKGSKDSGLSSGSSGHVFSRHNERAVENQKGVAHPNLGAGNALNRSVGARSSYRTEREMVRNFLKSQKRSGHTHQLHTQSSKRRNYRIEGGYEVEEIYLQKSSTSQLGITLGYDTTTPEGRLYVCEVLPTGLAAEDGRLQCGDIIRRVNGFEVYDAEEAILLFLEQDQDITLTVARKIKTTSNHLQLPSQSNDSVYPERSLEVLESRLLGEERNLRRIDSCGSLDSRTLKYSREDITHDSQIDEPLYTRRNRSSTSPHRHISPAIRSQSPLCSDSLSQPTTSSYCTQPDYQFRPISAQPTRPNTACCEFRTLDPRKLSRPSSTTPDCRHRIHTNRKYSVNHVSPTRSGPQSFRTLVTEVRQLPSRCEATAVDYMYNRSESLV